MPVALGKDSKQTDKGREKTAEALRIQDTPDRVFCVIESVS